MEPVFPAKLKKGDLIAVVAPSRSLGIVSHDTQVIASKRFMEELGLHVLFGAHVNVNNAFLSSGVEDRVADIHTAFADPEVKAIFTAIGGLNANQLLDYLDWELIAANPKIFCGYSDITVLQNAMFAKTGLVTYNGPHYSTFGQKHLGPYTLKYLIRALFEDDPFEIRPSERWNDDRWWEDQDNRVDYVNGGFWCVNPGSAQGRILGGNLSTFATLFGTAYMPSLEGCILFLEEDEVETPEMIDRFLQALIHQPGFSGVKGLVFGRFQKGTEMKRGFFEEIIYRKRELRNLPILARVDFGHTNPMFTFPIGGLAEIGVSGESFIRINKH